MDTLVLNNENKYIIIYIGIYDLDIYIIYVIVPIHNILQYNIMYGRYKKEIVAVCIMLNFYLLQFTYLLLEKG